MSPVSPLFHTEATVSIGLKNALMGTSILYWHQNIFTTTTTAKYFFNCLPTFIWENKEGWRQISRSRLRPLSTYITENQIRRTSGPVPSLIPSNILNAFFENPNLKLVTNLLSFIIKNWQLCKMKKWKKLL